MSKYKYANQIVVIMHDNTLFRNWINSLGVGPQVNHLFSDLYDGLVILRLEDTIKPGLVDWESRVVTPERISKIRAKSFQEVLGNCNYAVELARKLNLVVVGIAGELVYIIDSKKNKSSYFRVKLKRSKFGL